MDLHEKKNKILALVLREVNESIQLARAINLKGYTCTLRAHKQQVQEKVDCLPYDFTVEVECQIIYNGNYKVELECRYGSASEKISSFNDKPTRKEISAAFSHVFEIQQDIYDQRYAAHERSMLNQG